MATRTMFFRPFTDAANQANLFENDAGKWEWMIAEIEDGDPNIPAGWQATPTKADVVAPKPPKRKKPDAEETVAEEVPPNGDGD